MIQYKDGCGIMLWMGQILFMERQMTSWESPNCPKKAIFPATPRLWPYHNVKIVHRLGRAKSSFQSLSERPWPAAPGLTLL